MPYFSTIMKLFLLCKTELRASTASPPACGARIILRIRLVLEFFDRCAKFTSASSHTASAELNLPKTGASFGYEKRARSYGLSMVEVRRFELRASSTRNWRATICATPRYFIELKVGQQTSSFNKQNSLPAGAPRRYTSIFADSIIAQ